MPNHTLDVSIHQNNSNLIKFKTKTEKYIQVGQNIGRIIYMLQLFSPSVSLLTVVWHKYVFN